MCVSDRTLGKACLAGSGSVMRPNALVQRAGLIVSGIVRSQLIEIYCIFWILMLQMRKNGYHRNVYTRIKVAEVRKWGKVADTLGLLIYVIVLIAAYLCHVLKEEGGSQGQACLSGDLEHDWSNLNVF